MNTYCWIQGTFTIPSQIKKTSAHPGVGPMPYVQQTIHQDYRFLIKKVHEVNEEGNEVNHEGNEVNEDGDEVRHAWYQWVCLMLFVQAIMCYIPNNLWNYCEG